MLTSLPLKCQFQLNVLRISEGTKGVKEVNACLCFSVIKVSTPLKIYTALFCMPSQWNALGGAEILWYWPSEPSTPPWHCVYCSVVLHLLVVDILFLLDSLEESDLFLISGNIMTSKISITIAIQNSKNCVQLSESCRELRATCVLTLRNLNRKQVRLWGGTMSNDVVGNCSITRVLFR